MTPHPHPPKKQQQQKNQTPTPQKNNNNKKPNGNTKPTELLIVKRNDHMHNMTNNTGMQISTLVMKKSASLGLITRTTNTCQYSQRQHAFQWQSCLM